MVDSKGKVKIIHISDVKYVLPADRVISKPPDYQSFGRQSKLRIDPKDIPNLKWEPTLTINTMPASVYQLLFKDLEMKKIQPCKMQISTYTADTVKIIGS